MEIGLKKKLERKKEKKKKETRKKKKAYNPDPLKVVWCLNVN